MSDVIDLGPRRFKIGSGGVPNEGILIGRGGGFVGDYSDFVFLPNGGVGYLYYIGDAPSDAVAVRILTEILTGEYAAYLSALQRMNFFSIPSQPVQSDAF